MDRTIIIITGSPGTGKSYIADQIKRELGDIEIISYDQIKEKNFDLYGFDSAEQKEELNRLGLEEFYLTLRERMRRSRNILIEYPFFQRHKDRLQRLVDEYGYHAVTIYLYGDSRAIYRRERQRDQGEGRHRGHLVNRYHAGETDGQEAFVSDAVPSYGTYCCLLRERNYNVAIGPTVAVNVTDLAEVSCGQIIRRVRESIEGWGQNKVEYTWLKALQELEDILKMQRQCGADSIQNCIRESARVIQAGKRIFVCGNGGSASTASHIANDLICHMKNWNRENYPVLALTDNTAAITSIANDYGFREIFSRQLAAFGRPGDMLWAFSTSGNSGNCVAAVEQAKQLGMLTVGFTGKKGGELKTMCDLWVGAQSDEVTRVEEMHLILAHVIGVAVEEIVSPMADKGEDNGT
ncbi:MAG: SIS domain-containing protein [Enterocloster asparagiformis]|nr:SIS domain-containing protein [Enterocloster asparagiformis]